MESLIMGVLIAAACIIGFNFLQYITSSKSKQIEEAKKEVKVEFVRLSEDPHTKREGPNNTIRCSCGFIADSEHIFNLHIEMKPKMKEMDETGWPARHLQTVPFVGKSQKCVVSKGDLPYGMFTAITLTDNFDDAHVRTTLANFPELTKEVAKINPELRLVALVAVGSNTWRRWDKCPPQQLKQFEDIYAGNKTKSAKPLFPATKGQELFVFAKCLRQDLCYEVARQFTNALGAQNVAKVENQTTFAYKPVPMAAHDLTGFLDGTRNPDHLLRALVDQAIIFPSDQPAANNSHVGGSYMYAGKYVHDLPKFHSLPKDEQSQVIGRDYHKTCPHRGYDSRPENPQLKDAEDSAHINRGFGMMFRQAMPYVTETEQGLYFICFSRFLSEIDIALKRMAGNFASDGSTDNLFKITRSITNNYWYVPSCAELEALPQSALIDVKERQKIEQEQLQAELKTPDSHKQALEIIIEACTNCGYFTIFQDKKLALERALIGTPLENKYEIRVLLNPTNPRLSAFEVKMAKDGHELWSKLSQKDGRNNYPHVFPKSNLLVRELRKYLGVWKDGDEITLQDHQDSDHINARVGVW